MERSSTDGLKTSNNFNMILWSLHVKLSLVAFASLSLTLSFLALYPPFPRVFFLDLSFFGLFSLPYPSIFLPLSLSLSLSHRHTLSHSSLLSKCIDHTCSHPLSHRYMRTHIHALITCTYTLTRCLFRLSCFLFLCSRFRYASGDMENSRFTEVSHVIDFGIPLKGIDSRLLSQTLSSSTIVGLAVGIRFSVESIRTICNSIRHIKFYLLVCKLVGIYYSSELIHDYL